MKKSITILTGPQGSGNHLFSKVLGLSPDVAGWDALYEKQWSGHYEEPYQSIWFDVNNIEKIDWSADYHIISISCPVRIKGEQIIPNFELVITALQKRGFHVQVAIIGRDENIIKFQQARVRKQVTIDILMNKIDYLTTLDHVFLSHELLYLYKQNYVTTIYKALGLPLMEKNELNKQLTVILKNNSNKKYVKNITEPQLLDKIVWATGKKSRGIY